MNPPVGTQPRDSLGWLLTRFTRETPSVAHALAMSADGLPLATSDGLAADRVEQLAAVGSGLAGLTFGAAHCFGFGGVGQTVVDMKHGVLLVRSVSGRAHLVVLAAADCDLSQVSYETAVLARRVGAVLTPAVRTAPGSDPTPPSNDR